MTLSPRVSLPTITVSDEAFYQWTEFERQKWQRELLERQMQVCSQNDEKAAQLHRQWDPLKLTTPNDIWLVANAYDQSGRDICTTHYSLLSGNNLPGLKDLRNTQKILDIARTPAEVARQYYNSKSIAGKLVIWYTCMDHISAYYKLAEAYEKKAMRASQLALQEQELSMKAMETVKRLVTIHPPLSIVDSKHISTAIKNAIAQAGPMSWAPLARSSISDSTELEANTIRMLIRPELNHPAGRLALQKEWENTQQRLGTLLKPESEDNTDDDQMSYVDEADDDGPLNTDASEGYVPERATSRAGESIDEQMSRQSSRQSPASLTRDLWSDGNDEAIATITDILAVYQGTA